MIRLAAGSYAHHGRDYRGGGAAYDYAVTDKRVVSLWVRSAGDAEVVVTVQSSGGLRGLRYCLGGPPQGAPVLVQGNLAYFATTLSTGGGWHRLERDMASDVAAAWPGETLVSAKGLTLAPYTAEPMFVDDVRFSNAATVEHNVLGPGEVGHILRSRTTTVSGGAYAPADAWFAFNQVGSVVNHSNAAGAMTQAVEMDAWGNTLASAASGAWATDQTGWKHSTKRLDPAAGATYSHARWSDVTVGTWLSQEPTGADGPNLYHALLSNPTSFADMNGLQATVNFFPAGESLHTGANNVPAIPNRYVVGAHGNATGCFDQTGRFIPAPQLANEIWNESGGLGPGACVIIASCQVGQGTYPQRVADALGTSEPQIRIYANRDLVWYFPSGNIIASPTTPTLGIVGTNWTRFRPNR